MKQTLIRAFVQCWALSFLRIYAQDPDLITKVLAEAKAFKSQASSPNQRTQILMGSQIDAIINGLEESQRLGSITTRSRTDRNLMISPTIGTIESGANGVGFYMKQPDVRGKQEWAVLCADVISLLHKVTAGAGRNIYCPGAQAEASATKRVREFWPDPTKVIRSFSREPVGIRLDIYNVPGLIALLYVGDLDKVPDDINTRGYIASFLKSYTDHGCTNPPNADWQRLHYFAFYEMRAYDRAHENLQKTDEESVNRMINAVGQLSSQGLQGYRLLRQDGIEDGNTFLAHYSCNGTETQRMIKTLRDVVSKRLTMPPDIPNNDFFRAQVSSAETPLFPYTDEQSRMGRMTRSACEDRFPDTHSLPGSVPHQEESQCRCEALMLVQSGIPENEMNALNTHYDLNTLSSISQKFRAFAVQWPICKQMY